jgi:SAM-dependent methyltransferase
VEVNQLIAFVLLLWVNGFACLFLLKLFKTSEDPLRQSKSFKWTTSFEFSPESLRHTGFKSLALASVLGLFLEMLLIRWVSSEIRIFAYFKNFVLIACFMGFGLGYHLCRRRINLLMLTLPLLLLSLIIKLPWKGLRLVLTSLSNYLGAVSEVHIWAVPEAPVFWSTVSIFFYVLLMIIPLFTLIAMTFLPLGQLIGWHIENATNGILGYTVNVIASLLGILLYSLLCNWYLPPSYWFAVAAGLALILCWHIPFLRWAMFLTFMACAGLMNLKGDKEEVVHWSPYQKLVLAPRFENGELLAYNLTTNDVWYQQIIDLSDKFVSGHQYLFQDVPIEHNAYNLPYLFYPNPSSVLILGSGMGNDVAASLRNGAEQVVAVEIDPLIYKLGKELHFEKPYQSPRVRFILDDARSYIERSHDRFDLIVFSLLDSHTTSSHFSNIRIDNYVYTIEALRAAKALLNPDGIFIVKFQVDTRWIAGRLQSLLTQVFQSEPIQIEAEPSFTTTGRFYITGSRRRLDQIMSGRALSSYVYRRSGVTTEKAALTTDDWPYFYQQNPGVPASIIVVSIALGILCRQLIRKVAQTKGHTQWHFFFLGAAFLLLEVQIISKMALLFGTTWKVNSIVITGLLLLIVVANFVVSTIPRFSREIAYVGLWISIGISYLIPMRFYFFDSVWLKALAATLVLCLPVFFAGIIFIQSFSKSGFSGEALGSNLMGAVTGGLLESLSYWTGLKSLIIFAACFYLTSYLLRFSICSANSGDLSNHAKGILGNVENQGS